MLIPFRRSLASRRSDGVATVRASSPPSDERPGRRNWRLRSLANRQFHSVPEMSGAGSDGLIHGALRPVTAEP